MNEPQIIKQLYNQLLGAALHPFPQRGRLDTTCEKGVYIIYNPQGEVSHVGNTPRGQKGLCQRLNDHIGGSSSFANQYLKPRGLSVRNGYSYRLIEVPSARNRALLEALTCGSLCPEHIGTGERIEA